MPVFRTDIAVGVAWAIAAVGIWSGSLVLLRLGVTTSLNAYDLTALRFGTAAILLVGVLWRRGLALDQLGGLGFVVLIMCQGAPYILILSTGLLFAPVADAGAVNPGFMAVFVAVAGWILFGDRMTMTRAVGILGILAGAVIFSDMMTLRVASKGHLIFVITGGMWAVYALIVRRTRIQAVHATAIVAVGSAVVYLPVYVIALPSQLGRAPVADVVFQALYQGGLTSVVALFAFTRSAETLGATAGAALTAFIPVVTLALGAVFLGEAADLREIVAALVIGVGVALTVMAGRRSTP